MIPVPAGAHVWIAAGHTDMRKGFDGLASMTKLRPLTTAQKTDAAGNRRLHRLDRFATGDDAPPLLLFLAFGVDLKSAKNCLRRLHGRLMLISGNGCVAIDVK